MPPKKVDSSTKSRPADDLALPTPEQARAAFALALGPSMAPLRRKLLRLKGLAPQLLHLEGASAAERVSMALWWAALLNCETRAQSEAGGQSESFSAQEPCLACPTCLRLGANMYADLIVMDGREASLKIEDMRALQPLMGEPPHFGRRRVILLIEAQTLTDAAANSLLKVLEEPNAGTCFVFTVAQRERLLPTLVSRGFVLTLPWPVPGMAVPETFEPGSPASAQAEALRQWEQALLDFVRHGQGWFGKSGARGAWDANTAQHVLLLVQKALADVLAQRESPLALALKQKLKPLDPQLAKVRLLDMDEVLARSQEALQAMVNPTYVMDWMASRLGLLGRP